MYKSILNTEVLLAFLSDHSPVFISYNEIKSIAIGPGFCSNFECFHHEIDKLKTIFENNGYPKSFVYFCIKKYLDKVFIKKEVVLKASKKELICILAFLGKKLMQLRTCLVNSIEFPITMQAELVVSL